MSKLNLLYAFLGGAIVGAGAALLFAPEKGSELRQHIKTLLREKGIICDDDKVDEIIEEISTTVES